MQENLQSGLISPVLLKQFQSVLGITFRNPALLERALTHRSFAYEYDGTCADNEKLEFLGDSVLGLSISDFLYRNHPDEDEGFLSRIKSIVVSERVLARIARRLNFGKYLLLGKGEAQSGGSDRNSLLSNTVESVIGACYLDQGFDKVYDFVLSHFTPEIQLVLDGKIRYTYRTELQELIQKTLKTAPEYCLIDQQGPDNNRIFTMEVLINGIPYGTGKDRTKKEACQNASRAALEKIYKQIESGTLPEPLKKILESDTLADSTDIVQS